MTTPATPKNEPGNAAQLTQHTRPTRVSSRTSLAALTRGAALFAFGWVAASSIINLAMASRSTPQPTSTQFTSARPTATPPAPPPLPASRLNPIMSDPSIPANWGLASIESEDAWRLTRGSREIIVAVIDTGADVEHPALSDHLWINSGESGPDHAGRDKATNGIDDDLNGFVDDLHGWDFAGNRATLTDRHGHGTHIAGIIGNVAPRARLMILKYYDPQRPGAHTLANTVKAIRYAIDNGAHIINYSGGGKQHSAIEEEALRVAERKGILVVAAAGNESSNSDLHPFFPADYELSNILSVTAIDASRSVPPSSNYGDRTVDLAAPGVEILSALPGGKLGTMTGTSQATAFASGVAALLRAHHPDLTRPRDIIRHLMSTGSPSDALRGKTRAKTVLNSYRALAMKDRGVAASGSIARNTAAVDDKLFFSEPEKRRPQNAARQIGKGQ